MTRVGFSQPNSGTFGTVIYEGAQGLYTISFANGGIYVRNADDEIIRRVYWSS